jgi:hypothetical protein
MSDDVAPPIEPTPWSPSQHSGMKCACVSHDARSCFGVRYGIDPDDYEEDDRCDCICHDRDEFEEDDY